MAITIRFLADVADWLKGLNKSEDALSDVEKSLADTMRKTIEMGKQAGLTSDQIADDFSEAFGIPLDRAKKAVQAVTDESKDMGSAGSTNFGKVKDAAKDVGGGLSELGSIARSVLSGDFSAGAGDALAALGGIAAAAGVGGAAGGAVLSALGGAVGAWIAELDLFRERTKKIAEETSAALVDVGGAFTDADLESRIRAVTADTEKWAAANTIQNLTGLSMGEVLRGLAGDTESAAVVSKAYADAVGEVGGKWEQVAGKDLLNATQAVDGVNQGLQTGAEKSAAVKEALGQQADATSHANSKWDEFRGNLGRSLPDIPPVKIRIDTSAYDNWQPPQKRAGVIVNVPRGVDQAV